MPVPALKSMAKRAGVSLSNAEEKWKQAKKEATKQGKGSNYAYITGIVKKMLKVESLDLLLCGAPVESICECVELDDDMKMSVSDVNSLMSAVFIAESCRIERGLPSNIVCVDELGNPRVRPSFSIEIQKIEEKFTPEQVAKFFPNIDQDYVRFLCS